jgi:hypothetical protein
VVTFWTRRLLSVKPAKSGTGNGSRPPVMSGSARLNTVGSTASSCGRRLGDELVVEHADVDLIRGQADQDRLDLGRHARHLA